MQRHDARSWLVQTGLVLGFFLTLGAAHAQALATLEGRVTAAGVGVPGAQVKALPNGGQTTTNPTGQYSLSVKPGTYTVTVSKAGLTTVSNKATLAAGQRLKLDFNLTTTKMPAQQKPAEMAEAEDADDAEGSPAVLMAEGGGRAMPAGGDKKDRASLARAPMPMRPSKSMAPPAPPVTSANLMVAGEPMPVEASSREGYDGINENPFKSAEKDPLSTFSIDVDTASYANVRRFIEQSQRPPHDAVRIEELVNYFTYDYEGPKDEHPFAVHTEVSVAPWNAKHRLVQIGLQGRKLDIAKLPPSNLVFLLDVSGSMNEPNKLPLLKAAFALLVNNLRPQDQVAIVVYAGAAGLVLPSTPGKERDKILAALNSLSAGGSTAGGAGIQLAYQVAQDHFLKGGNNRVILATDGDFNVGTSSDGELERMIEEKRKAGVFLTVLGFGQGNYQDAKMQKLADKGNGNHAYIDSILEAKKVLVSQMGGTLFTIAKDVKLQLEFNPAKVKGYRLIGYENRVLRNQDFNDDTKDAGELGSGHTVTAFYEIIPAGSPEVIPGVDELKYQATVVTDAAKKSPELLTVKLRYKKPDGDQSSLITHPLLDQDLPLEKTSENFRFASAVVEFGLLLRDSPNKGTSSFEALIKRARGALGKDAEGYRFDFIKLAEKAALLPAR